MSDDLRSTLVVGNNIDAWSRTRLPDADYILLPPLRRCWESGRTRPPQSRRTSSVTGQQNIDEIGTPGLR
jgi:hypothetical protein